MPPRRTPFTYIPPTHIAPIECPHCEDTAHPLWHSPLPAGLKGEMRVFECVGCGRESRMIVNA